MKSEEWAAETVKKLDFEKPKSEPKRFVDFDVTTSFAHCTPNITIDEVFGYKRLETLERITEGRLNCLFLDYDATIPSKEKPPADSFETIFKTKEGRIEPQIFFSGIEDTTISLQNLYKEAILSSLDKNWPRIISESGLPKTGREKIEKRFLDLIKIIKESTSSSNSNLEFLETLRRNFLELTGIYVSGKPESKLVKLFAQKLEEDLEAGFPFWKIELPPELEAKHKSNEGTYLFWGVNSNGKLVKVNFFENPERIEFDKAIDNRIIIPVEQIPKAMSEREIIPTVTMLNYIVLSPSRKPKENERKKRIHVAGNFMAGSNGYALKLIPYLNKTPGFDEVQLVCTGYDGRCNVKEKNKSCIGFGVVFPHFGKKGLEKFLESDSPFSLEKGNVIGDKI